MKARQVCAVLGIAAAIGAVVFMGSLTASHDAQATAVAERMLKALPVDEGALTLSLALDFRPNGHVMQGPPLTATLAEREGVEGIVVAKAVFAQRRLEVPPLGTELKFVGRKGAYSLKLTGIIDWDKPLRGYPNAFVSPETAESIGEDWLEFEPRSAEELSAGFKSDAGRNFDRARSMLIWAAALTALCLLMNSLFLSVEARRRELAILRTIGMTRGGVARLVMREALALTAIGLIVGVAVSLFALWLYVLADSETFPEGMAISFPAIIGSALASPVVAVLGGLLSLRSALSVRPLEAASGRSPRHRPVGMLIAFACGFGAFVAVEVWGTSLTKPFIPSKEWPDAIVSILPGGVSSFQIRDLQSLNGVRKIAELQPLQVPFDPLEEMSMPGGAKKAPPPAKGPGGPMGMGRGAQYRNALLLASDWLPPFKFIAGDHDEAARLLGEGDNCVITEMMARARKLKMGDEVKLDSRGLKLALRIVGIVDLNWHMVTSRGLVRGLNRMPVNTDGPVFVSFDTLAACDARPQEMVSMTHLWLDYEPSFVAEHGVFPAGRIVEREIVTALGGADTVTDDGEVRGNAVRLHARDEVADGTLAHGTDLVGAMARVPFIFLTVVSLGFVAMLVASVDARRREFTVLRSIGATRFQIARVLIAETLSVALKAELLGLLGGSLLGWLATAGTRAAMANWGLPSCFDIPVLLVIEGALGAIAFALAVAIPTALILVGPARR